MSDLRRGKVDLILVTDLSRLSRNIPGFCGILETLKGNETSFLSIKEQFDTSTPAGKVMLYNMINLAQFEREQTAERVSLGCYSRAMRGLLNGGPEILGFDKTEEKKNTYVINELEAEQVRTIFKMFLECGSLNRTIKKIEELGLRPKAKKNRRLKIVDRGLWSHQTLGDLLKNMAYVRLLEVNKKNKNSDDRNLKPHQQYQIVKASWPAIVPRDFFDRVQLVLSDNLSSERRRLKGAERRVFVASGIIYCKECGRSMVGQSAHGRMSTHRYYIHGASRGDVNECSVKRIRAQEIEDAIGRHVSVVLKEGNYLDAVAKRIAGEGKEKKLNDRNSKGRLRKEIQACERDMDAAFKLQVAAKAGSASATFVLEKIELLGNKKADLEKAVAEFEASRENVVSLDEVRQGLESRVHMVTKGWAKLPDIQKRQAIRRLVEKVAVGSDGLDLYYYTCATQADGTSAEPFGESKTSALCQISWSRSSKSISAAEFLPTASCALSASSAIMKR